jgi:5-methylcytosine-specific restriction endonuclease McrA
MAIAYHLQQVLDYDAGPLLTRLTDRGLIRPSKRFQEISIDDIPDPQPEGLCRCGCGRSVAGTNRKWYEARCRYFADTVAEVIRGRPRLIYKLLVIRHGDKCANCGVPSAIAKLEVDHIHPVANGGGGRWLENYQLLCTGCHRAKTNQQVCAALLRRRPDAELPCPTNK